MLIVGPGEGGRDDGGRDEDGCWLAVRVGVAEDGGAELRVGVGDGGAEVGGAFVLVGVGVAVTVGCGVWSVLRAGTLAAGGNCRTGRSSRVSRITCVQVRVG
jgi:hypothetical protein